VVKLHFTCPRTGQDFETAHFNVVMHRGVVTTADGNRRLDATVALCDACPLCGEWHRFRAEELACPLGEGAA
jgi:hypothetical protein